MICSHGLIVSYHKELRLVLQDVQADDEPSDDPSLQEFKCLENLFPANIFSAAFLSSEVANQTKEKRNTAYLSLRTATSAQSALKNYATFLTKRFRRREVNIIIIILLIQIH